MLIDWWQTNGIATLRLTIELKQREEPTTDNQENIKDRLFLKRNKFDIDAFLPMEC